MSTAYTPRPGSVAERAITHLRTLAPRAELSGAALAEAIGVDHIRATGDVRESGFIAPALEGAGDATPGNGITGIVRHRLAG